MPRGNIDNLVSNDDRTPEQRRANARKAGIASGEARRAKKTLREHLDILLAQTMKDPKTGQEMTYKESLGVAIIAKALAGSTKAWELIRDTLGEKPVDKTELTGADGKPLEVVRYITPEEQAAVRKHIEDTINGTGH